MSESNDLMEEFGTLKQELIAYYQNEFSSPAACYTLPVTQKEVEIIKRLILIAGGRDAQEAQIECWNIARVGYPKMCLAVRPDFPFYREGWNRRGNEGSRCRHRLGVDR